ncbi:hypothetical protein MRY82_01270 [bacterium]|nr:hypothetical protein [bacterium]
MLSYCASKPKVPGSGNTKKKTNNDQVTEGSDTSNKSKTMALEKTETVNSDHVEVSFSLKNTDSSESYTIFYKWNKEALLEADADIASLDWEDAEQGKSGMKLKLMRDSEEAHKAYVYVKVQDKQEKIVIKESFVIDVPALEEEIIDEEDALATNAIPALEGDKVLCAGQRDDVAVVLSYDSTSNQGSVNISRDNLKTWSVLATLEVDLEHMMNCHIGMHENHMFIVSDSMLSAGNSFSNQYVKLNFNSDSGAIKGDLLSSEEFLLIADQFNIKDIAVVGDRAYIALSNTEQNKLISLYIQPTANAMFDGDKTRVATLSGISPIESIFPEEENIDDFYDFIFLTQDNRSYLGNSQTGIDWTVSNDDKVDLMVSNNASYSRYFVQYKAANKKNTYYDMVTTFDPVTKEESYSWNAQEGELTIPLTVETITKGADNQLILHNESQVFFLQIDEDARKETGTLLGLKSAQNS